MYYLLIVIIVILLLILLYLSFIKPLDYWKERQIPYIKGLPFLGNFSWHFFKLKPFVDDFIDLYNLRPNDKYYGIFLFNTPYLVIQDLDLIKSVTIKNFEHFTDHTDFIFKDFDPLFVKNVFSLKGKSWHSMRATLSPAFTGSKMRGMLPLMSECAQHTVDHFKKELDNIKDKNGSLDLNFKDVYVRLGMDVIASTAFGLKVDSFKEKNNKFRQMVTEVGIMSTWRMALAQICPNLMKFLNISTIPTHPCDYFRDIVREAMAYRERENVSRPDMLNLLMEAKKGTLKYDDKLDVEEKMNDAEFLKNSEKLEKLTDEDICAQAFVFILGGVDTVSDLLSFATHEIAANPDVQDRLYSEIKQSFENNNRKISYDLVQKMKYLDAVLSETLRKWPPAVFLDRICTKSFTIEDNDRDITIEKGMGILIPVYCMHHDPKYFERPNVFNPDRFTEENVKNINPFTYMPFGTGPRNCIGSRFALLEAKLVLCYLLLEFEIFANEKSVIPPVLDRSSIQLRFKKGYNFGLRLRNSKM